MSERLPPRPRKVTAMRPGGSHRFRPLFEAIPALLARAASDPRQMYRWLLGIGVLLLAVGNAIFVGTASVPAGSLRVELRAAADLIFRVRYDQGYGFVEDERITRLVKAETGTQMLLIPLPLRPVRGVELGTVQGAGRFNIHAISVIRDADGSTVQAFQVEALTVKHGALPPTPDVEGVDIVPKPGATHLRLRVPVTEPITLAPTVWEWTVRLLPWDACLLGLYAGVVWLALFGWPPASFFIPRWDNLWALAARWFPDRWAALLFVLPPVAVFCGVAAAQRDSYYLEAEVTCDRPVEMQFYFDVGTGFKEVNSVRASVPTSTKPRKVCCPVPPRPLYGLRFDPAQGPVAMRVNALTLRSAAEDWVHGAPWYAFDLRTLRPGQQMTELVHEDNGTIRLLVVDGANEPTTLLELPAPLSFGVNWLYVAGRTLLFILGWLAVWIVGAEGGRRLPAGVWAWGAARLRAIAGRLSPAQAIWLVGAASVLWSCHPVIFGGKSFASVNFLEGTYQLYQRFPTLPGTADAVLKSSHGADVGTMAWQAAPAAVLESRALLHDHELPLWDRFTGAGTPLLGQGQSMIGDPLHWMVVAAGGRAWAWDVKFVLAKLIFVAGVGLLVLAATSCLPAALLLTFSAAFIGFWAYRLNHPAYFSLCYAPWILFAWIEIARLAPGRHTVGWTIALVLINWTELNSGSIPEAFALLIYLNLTGALVLLLTRHPTQEKFQRLLVVAAGGLVFFLLAAPVLLAFFTSRANSGAAAAAEPFRQWPSSLLLGFFDDLFLRPFTAHENIFGPALNLLVLGGVLLALGACRRLSSDRLFVAILGSALLLTVTVFGPLPLAWCSALPLAGSISHPTVAFATVLIVELFVLAGFGLKQCFLPSSQGTWKRDLLTAAGGLALLLAAFCQTLFGPTPVGFTEIGLATGAPVGSFCIAYLPLLVGALILTPLALRRLWHRGVAVAPLLVLGGCLFLLHWRQGFHPHNVFGRYTPGLPDRLDLLARSPALDALRADAAGPARAVGLGANLMMGYNAIAGIEGFNDPGSFGSPFVAELKTIGMGFTHDWLQDSLDKNRLAEVKRFYDLFNVRYYLTLPGDRLTQVPGLRLLSQFDLDLYRNENAWPRAFFVDRLQEYSGTPDFVREVMAGDGQPFAAIDVGEYVFNPGLAGRFRTSSAGRKVVPATNYRLTSDWTYFDLDAPAAGVVVLTESFFPDAIFARLNGHPAHVFRVNHAFRGLIIDKPGHYRVTFSYHPPHFILAMYGMALGWGVLALASWLLWRRRPVARPDAGTPPPLDRLMPQVPQEVSAN